MTSAPRDAESGFTLLEAMAAVAITGVILGALGSVAGQWLPQWRHGFVALQNADDVAQTLDRLVGDISSAEFARLDPKAEATAFKGGADLVLFARASTGPNATPRLDYVRIGAVATPHGMETQRARAPFAPGPIGPFRDVVTVLRPPFRLSFAYEAADGHWTTSWSALPALPHAIRLTVKSGDVLVATTAFPVNTTSGPDLTPPSSEQKDPSQPAGGQTK